jgi:hypothetical protein
VPSHIAYQLPPPALGPGRSELNVSEGELKGLRGRALKLTISGAKESRTHWGQPLILSLFYPVSLDRRTPRFANSFELTGESACRALYRWPSVSPRSSKRTVYPPEGGTPSGGTVRPAHHCATTSSKLLIQAAISIVTSTGGQGKRENGFVGIPDLTQSHEATKPTQTLRNQFLRVLVALCEYAFGLRASSMRPGWPHDTRAGRPRHGG